MNPVLLLALCALPAIAQASADNAASHVTLAGPWRISVSPGRFNVGASRVAIAAPATFDIAPSALVSVKDERHAPVPTFDPHKPGWTCGVRLNNLIAGEGSKFGMLVPESVVVKAAAGESPALKLGIDYALEHDWASIGRLDGGAITADQAVYVDYQYGTSRIDSIMVDEKGRASLVPGAAAVVTPVPPSVPAGCVSIANIWVPGRLAALTADNLYPIIEPVYPEAINAHPVAETMLPKTWAKLTSGKTVDIVVWGDSTFHGGGSSDVPHRFQERWAVELAQKFPAATIHMHTTKVGGRINSYRDAASEQKFEDEVVAPHPDLVLIECFNDGGMNADMIEKAYSLPVELFKKEGIECIIVLPHFGLHIWMHSPTERIETDARPFVEYMKEFAARHNVPSLDWPTRWGHLVKEGIPYETLLVNGINHPNNRGHQMLADALMEMFGGPAK